MLFLFKKYISLSNICKEKRLSYIFNIHHLTRLFWNFIYIFYIISLKKIISHLSHLSNFPPLSSSPFVPTHPGLVGVPCPPPRSTARRTVLPAPPRRWPPPGEAPALRRRVVEAELRWGTCRHHHRHHRCFFFGSKSMVFFLGGGMEKNITSWVGKKNQGVCVFFLGGGGGNKKTCWYRDGFLVAFDEESKKYGDIWR